MPGPVVVTVNMSCEGLKPGEPVVVTLAGPLTTVRAISSPELAVGVTVNTSPTL